MVGAGVLNLRSAPAVGVRGQTAYNRVGRPARSCVKVTAAAAASNGGASKKPASKVPPVPKGKKAEDIVKADVESPAAAQEILEQIDESAATKGSVPSSRNAPSTATSRGAASTKSTVDQGASSAKDGVDTAADAVKDTSRATKRNVDQGADSIKEGIDDAADTAKDTARDTRVQTSRTARDVKENVDEGAEAVKEGVDVASRQIRRTAADVEEGLDDAVDQAAEQIDQTSRQLQQAADRAPQEIANAAQQAVDATADGINAAQRAFERATEPGPPAPFSGQSLTSLPRNPFESRPGPNAGQQTQVDYFKRRLLYVVAGLDRGLAANASAAAEVEASVFSLTSASSPVVLSWTSEEGAKTTTLAQLNGTWRLVYSSSFAAGNLGGRGRGGGSGVQLLPAQLGQVYQTISAYTARLDNVVELYSRVNLPQIPGLPEQEPIVTTLTLKHLFDPLGGSTSQITYEDTEVKTTGGLGGLLGKLPELRLPQLPEGLRPSRNARTSTFETLFLDDDFRVSRGRNGELRVFIKT